MEYATIDDVKRLLRVLPIPGDNQHKIRFSDSYTIPEANTTNAGSLVLGSKMIINQAYAGSEFWHIEFASPTQYTLYRSEDTSVNDGTGSVSVEFTSLSKIITIPVAAWLGGPAVAGDKFKFRTDSNISDDDVAGFIDDSGAVIDVMLRKELASTYVPFSDDPESVNFIPTVISKASAYIAASLLYTSIYSAMSLDVLPTLVRRWYNLGRDLVKLFMESIDGKEKNAYQRYGHFITRQPLFTKVGILEAAGVDGVLVGEVDTQNVDYDADYNTKEQLGST